LASSLPIVRQIAWLSVIPQLIVMGAMVAAAYALGFDDPLVAATLTYLLLSITLRRVIPKDHRAGIRLFKQERFAEAVPKFQASYEFFLKHPWLDRWRAIVLLSSSRVTYREMALLNIAFCLSQSGQRSQALASYKRTLAEFPDSKLAASAVRMMDDGGAPGQAR
jgi:tetratricopeptide (TPR) repeat protein